MPTARTSLATAVAVAVALAAPPAAAQQPTATITGKVTDAATGAPLAGICVASWSDFGEETAALTAADGTYRLDGLAGGDYLVAYNLPPCSEGAQNLTYAAEFYADATTFADATPVSVAAGATAAGNDAALERAGVIAGTVTDGDSSAAVAGICVVVYSPDTGAFAGEVTTATDGRYAVAARPGSWVAAFYDCDREFYVTEWYRDAASEEEATPLVVEAGAEAAAHAALTLGGAVSGTVTALHTGAPVPVCVDAFETGTGAHAGFSVSAEDGSYTVGGLPAGTYLLSFNGCALFPDAAHPGYGARWFADAADRAGAEAVTVVKGRTTATVEAVLPPVTDLSVACPPQEIPPAGFADVPTTNVHRATIDCMAWWEIARGTAPGRYSPDRQVTRGQMAAFLARTLEQAGVELPANPPDAFADDEDSVFEAAINQLAALGVVSGRGARLYAPGEAVTRAAMATFLVKAYEAATGLSLRAVGDAFTDDDTSTHHTSINRAATAGIVGGKGGGRYAPAEAVRRDAMASFLARVLDRTLKDASY